MRLLVIGWIVALTGLAADRRGEEATIEIHGGEARVSAEGPRPVEWVATALANRFGILISVEDPQYRFGSDVKDVTAEVSKSPNAKKRVLIPAISRLTVKFAVTADGQPESVTAMLEAVVDTANAQFPFAYKLVSDGETFAIVPTRTRGKDGKSMDVQPMLDRLVTIPEGVRPIHQSAQIMAESLGAQTGARVACCMAGVAGGVPWGLKPIAFAARNEPARRILRRLIRAEYPNAFWVERCDPDGAWCAIQVRAIVREAHPLR